MRRFVCEDPRCGARVDIEIHDIDGDDMVMLEAVKGELIRLCNEIVDLQIEASTLRGRLLRSQMENLS